MRICHVVYGYYPQDMRPRRAGESISLLGNEVHVISMMDAGESREERIRGVWVHRFPFRIKRGRKLRYLFQYMVFLVAATVLLLKLHLSRKLDIVHVHSLPDFQVVCALPEKLLGARVILDLHEAMPELFAARFRYGLGDFPVRLVATIERMSCWLADSIIVVNEMMRRRLLAKGIGDDKITVIMNSPPLDTLVRKASPGKRGELGIGDELAIVYVGGVNRERDLATLVRAASILRAAHPVKLAIIGPGDEVFRSELISLAQTEGLRTFVLRDRVLHTEAFGYIGLSDIGPITYERNALTDLSMPSKALEYTAAGKPLVIANLRGIREIYGDAALYYEPGDADDLARQFARLIEDPRMARELANRATGVLNRCSWSVMEARLLTLYGRLAPHGMSRPTTSRETGT